MSTTRLISTAFYLRPSSDNIKYHASVLCSQYGSEAAPAYSLRHPDPASPGSKNRYAVALYDSYNPDILYGEVLLVPQWTQPSLSQEEIRRNGGVPPAPQPVLPTSFIIQLYNPDQQVVVQQGISKWSATPQWVFEMPQQSFRQPSVSSIDRTQSDPTASETTPKLRFKWKKDGKLSKDYVCSLSGKNTNPDGSKRKNNEPDITVSIFKHLKEITMYEPNLSRVEMEDPKGLEVVILLSAIVIREVYNGHMRETFNVSDVPRRLSNEQPLRKSSADRTHRHRNDLPPSQAPPLPSQRPPLHVETQHSRPPPTDPRSQWEIDAETARLKKQVEKEERERRRAEHAETKRVKKMLEDEERRARQKHLEIDRETERLKREFEKEQRQAQRNPKPPLPGSACAELLAICNTIRLSAEMNVEHLPFHTLFVGFLAVVYKYIIEPAFISPLAKIPSASFLSSISSQWISRKRQAKQETRTIYSLHQKHGSVVRLGPNEISVNSLDGLRTIYHGEFEKHSWYSKMFVNYEIRNTMTSLDRNSHSVSKRWIANIYSKSYLHDSSDMRTITDDLIYHKFLPIIDLAARNSRPIDIFDLTQALGMDFTTAYLFGSENGSTFMQDVDYRRHWFAQYAVLVNQSPEKRANGLLEQWCMSMCQAAQLSMGPEKPTVGTPPVPYSRRLRCVQMNGADAGQTTKLVASEMLDLTVAGHETLAITLTYLMYEMSQRPLLQKQLREELLTLDPPVRCRLDISGNDEEALPTPRALDALPFLDALLQETLRLYPAVPAPLPRVTPDVPGGTTIEGYANIPGGVRVSSNAYSMHRLEDVFPEPEVWLPERWLTADQKGLEQMRRAFFTFGAGGRSCLGRNFAMQAMKWAVAAVYTNYVTSIAEDSDMEQADVFTARPVGNKLVLRFEAV
ncbi:MAG: hypothetical protein Q9207_004990 [Kuettlingeria erythrocarpa]